MSFGVIESFHSHIQEVVENGPDNYDGSLGFGLDPVERLLVSIENQERLEKRAEEEDRVVGGVFVFWDFPVIPPDCSISKQVHLR